MAENLISWIEENLDGVSYRQLMDALAENAVQILSHKLHAASECHVIAAVEDFDVLALPIISHLEELGRQAVWSCIWPDRKDVGSDHLTTIAPIVVSVDQAPLNGRKHLILVSSCADTSAVLESMLIHAHSSPRLEYSQISIIAPFFTGDVRTEFRRAMPRRNVETYSWLGFFQVTPEAALRLKDLFIQKTALAVGVDNPEALRRYMPSKILSRFDDTPKSTPSLSM